MNFSLHLFKIGEEVVSIDGITSGNAEEKIRHFEYRKKRWKLMPELEEYYDDIAFVINVRHKNRFNLVETEDNLQKNILALAYNKDGRFNEQVEASIRRLFPVVFKNYEEILDLNTFQQSFTEDNGAGNVESDGKADKLMKRYVTTKLYDALYIKHDTKEWSGDLQGLALELPERFQPVLRRYQERTVKWLLIREKHEEIFPGFTVPLAVKDDTSSLTIYKHKFWVHFQSESAAEIRLPPGGILADEMGLGKTVEILALVLLNPRSNVMKFNFNRSELDGLDVIPAKRRRLEKIFCICFSKSQRNIIECENCRLWQHFTCVAKYNVEHTDAVNNPYICPRCWQELTANNLIESAATFIVTPYPIKLQWLSEIRRHVNPTLRVLLYQGVSRWISPRQLADYDIVLTDYNVLRGDFYHTPEHVPKRVTRNEPRSIRLQSPLLMVHWWRLCLDEAQMVDTNTRMVAPLVRQLPATNRWAVTGTPINRSIDDLKPLLEFIGFDEICDPPIVWDNLVHDFILHHESTERDSMLIDLLQKCMWRTCKSKVIDELQIPPQIEVVHHIELSNLEKLFYTEQHGACEMSFIETVGKYVERADGLLTISPQILKIILQPLLKIRQCCTIPVVMGNKTNNTGNKQFLQPKELHSHMKSTNEIQCKSELRSMASSYNGIAAIYFLRRNFDEAIKNYQSVLQLAGAYSDMNLSVDSLLQIHALHNLLQVYYNSEQHVREVSDGVINKYEEQLYALEWKYLQPYAAMMGSMQDGYKEACERLQNIQYENESNLLRFISEVISSISDCPDNIQEGLWSKINEECRPNFPDSDKLLNIQSTIGLLYLLTVWHEKMELARDTVRKEFDDIKFFTDNVRSRNQVNSGTWRHMMQFVSSVYDCHLSEIREVQKDDDKKSIDNADKPKNNKKKNLCKLCEMKNILNDFECLIFNKTIAEETKVIEGVDKPSLEIHLIKVLFNFIKSKQIFSSFHIDIDKHWESIECTQTICKKLIKYWIEIEYTVKAYDELDMCKMRLSLTDNEEDKSNFRILKYEIDDMLAEQKSTLHEAQRQFVSKLARLKYIKHLESDADPGPCPICRSEDEFRFGVLECGHYLCYPCLKFMCQYEKKKIIRCSICRNEQSSKGIYYVTRSTPSSEASEITCKGNYSSKIIYIVGTILKLQKDCNENDPKILIFSQWQPILNAIAAALTENGISHRLQWSPRSIEEFKDPDLGITCMLMLLAKGSKGLNLIEATHVFLVEPILNPGEELQAIGRVHRFGQTKTTTVHRFIVDNTIDENIFNFVRTGGNNRTNWEIGNICIADLQSLFKLKNDITIDDIQQEMEIE